MPNLTAKFVTHLALTLVCLLASMQTHASGNYQVEVVIFKHVYGATGNNPTLIDKIPSYASTWPLSKRLIPSYAKKIASSPNYQVLSYSSWGQKSSPFKSSAAKEFTQAGLNGYIKVFANQLLFAEVKLTLNGHYLSERRRLKLNELHYFDNAGVGVLMQVSRVE
jgi:hypothetical protein